MSLLNRLSINTLLKLVVGMFATAVIVLLSVAAWTSWSSFNAASKMVRVAEASSHLFTGLVNLRLDRSWTFRDMQAEGSGGVSAMLQEAREAEMPALKKGLAVLQDAALPEVARETVALANAVVRLDAMHKDTVVALAQTKTSRPAGSAKQAFDVADSAIDLVEKMSTQLARSVSLRDPFIDKLLEIKELAWTVRNATGDASVMISNALVGRPMPPNVMEQYAAISSRADTAWNAIDAMAAGLTLPAELRDTIKSANEAWFSADYTKLRFETMRALVAGKKAEYAVNDWVKVSVAKQAPVLSVATVALKIVKDRGTEMRAAAKWSLGVELVLLAAAVGFSILTLWLISRRVTAPLRLIQDGMMKVSGGDFNVTLPKLESKDEVAQIVNAVRTMIEQVRHTIVEIKSSSREVTNASAEISLSTTDLSQRTEEQAASLEETSASMEQIANTVRRNAENAKEATKTAMATRDVADRGGEVAGRAVGAMSRIEESSRKIADIISVIDEIARQTNLLALNAAVEAARAGEAGRGFAVVASEVRSLAQRSSQAAKDIAALINNSTGQVKEGVELVNQAGKALGEIVESIRVVADAVSDIATASAEQATGIDEVKKTLDQMDELTQRNSALVEENAATALTLEHQAKTMDEQVAFFQVDGQAPPATPAVAAKAEKIDGTSKRQPSAQRVANGRAAA